MGCFSKTKEEGRVKLTPLLEEATNGRGPPNKSAGCRAWGPGIAGKCLQQVQFLAPFFSHHSKYCLKL